MDLHPDRYAHEPAIRPVVADGRIATIAWSAIEEELQCSICKQLPQNPVTLKVCLHRLCQACFDRFYQSKTTNRSGDRPARLQCPMCNAELSSRRVAISDPVYANLLAAIVQHAGDCGGAADSDDDDDDLSALVAQAQKQKDASTRAAFEHQATEPPARSSSSSSGGGGGRASAPPSASTPSSSSAAARASAPPPKKREAPVAKTSSAASGGSGVGATASHAGVKRGREGGDTPRLAAGASMSGGGSAPWVTTPDASSVMYDALLRVDVVALLATHPRQERFSDVELGAIRCYGATTVAYLKRYIAFRLREPVPGKGDASDLALDGSGVHVWIGKSTDPLTPITELSDEVTLAAAYLHKWDDTEIPIILMFATE